MKITTTKGHFKSQVHKLSSEHLNILYRESMDGLEHSSLLQTFTRLRE